MALHELIIDCKTSGKRQLINWLDAMPSVESIDDMGEYSQDRQFSKIHVMCQDYVTEDKLDDALWLGHFDYIGVVKA